MFVSHIKNDLFNSNSFVIETSNSKCIIVDPGSSLAKIILLIHNKGYVLKAVFLTHEHYDHLAGVDALADIFNFELICSKACEKGMRDPKHNFSNYMDEIRPFSVKSKAHIIEDDSKIEVAGLDCSFIITPGHSPGGMCIKIGNSVFTGDTLLNNTKTPLNLFHSNKPDYKQSVHKLKTAIQVGDTIYPGHGDPFNVTSELMKI